MKHGTTPQLRESLSPCPRTHASPFSHLQLKWQARLRDARLLAAGKGRQRKTAPCPETCRECGHVQLPGIGLRQFRPASGGGRRCANKPPEWTDRGTCRVPSTSHFYKTLELPVP